MHSSTAATDRRVRVAVPVPGLDALTYRVPAGSLVPAKGADVLKTSIAEPLGYRGEDSVTRAAKGVLTIANLTMSSIIKKVSIARGYDPREFTLAAFGGAGPLHAAALASELGIAEVLCPPIPGAFSALGLVGTDLKRDYVRTVYTTTAAADPTSLQAAFAELEREGTAMLDRAGVAAERRRFERSIDARYERQSYELSVPVPARAFDQAALSEIADAFHDRHRQTYGHDNRSEPVQLVSIRVAAIGEIPPLPIREKTAGAGSNAVKSKRQVWFRATGTVDATIYDRGRMAAGLVAQGPAVIESLESTILVPPDWQAKMNEDGFVMLTRRDGSDT